MRIRSVKPELLRDQWLQRQEPLTRVVMIGLLMTADDSGKYEADRDVLRGQIAPCDHPKAFNSSYDTLLTAKKVLEYESDGNRYGVIPMFAVHQRIDKPQRSELPNPPPELIEALVVRLTTHPKWKKVHRQNLLRMIGETEENIRRVFQEDSANVLGMLQEGSCPSRARASGSMEHGERNREEEGKGGPAPGGDCLTPTGRMVELHSLWCGVHERCRDVSFEHFVEICRVNPKADVGKVIERLRMELTGQAWPRNKTAAQLLRTRIVYGELDAERERAALRGERPAAGAAGVAQNAPPTAEELREKRG